MKHYNIKNFTIEKAFIMIILLLLLLFLRKMDKII